MTAVIDVETDSANPNEAKLKFFGGLDCETGEVVVFDYLKNVQIKDYIKKHKILIGFNLKAFDKVVLENYGIDFKYNIIVDLLEALAPKGNSSFDINFKDRLHDINPCLILKNYKLKTIIEALELDKENKGEIDYSIFKKDSWNDEEIKEIEKYLKQDLAIEFKLFNWYKSIFEPLKPYLPIKEFENYKHLTCTSGCLAYKVLCHMMNKKEEYSSDSGLKNIKIEGGHHIHPRYEKVKGNIICRDFVSHYPTIIIMNNLLSDDVVSSINKILDERLKAKKNKDKTTALALKVPLNSFYGILGKSCFKNIYNPFGASETTRIGRELLKRYAKTLDVSGFHCLYGFTDSVFVGIPSTLSEDDLNITTKYFIDKVKKEVPNPIDSFDLGIDKKLKFMWFIDKKDNNYLWVDENDKIGIKGGLFDKNVPECIKVLFELYISKKIKEQLDVDFTFEEVLQVLNKILSMHPELSAESYSVKDVSFYKIKTSLQYQISSRYGSGVHSLIPNNAGVGVGRSNDLKYCSIQEFKEHNLDFNSICIKRMMKYIEPFYSTKEKVYSVDDLDNLKKVSEVYMEIKQ